MKEYLVIYTTDKSDKVFREVLPIESPYNYYRALDAVKNNSVNGMDCEITHLFWFETTVSFFRNIMD